MNVITIPKKEYQKLVETKLRYEYLRRTMEEDIFASPPKKNIRDVLGGFKVVKKYNQKFLGSLENGLKRSSYFRR